MSRTPTEAIASYITDMLALEDHIDKAIRAQIKDLGDEHGDVARQLEGVHQVIMGHKGTLEQLAERRDANRGLADAVKRAGSALAGFGAAAIDLVRTEKLPKDLRDDFTAASLATIGYLMLHTTALSLQDEEVATVAQRHFANYARVTMMLQNIIPGAVIRFLQDDGLPARSDVLTEINRTIDRTWETQSGRVPDADDVSVRGTPLNTRRPPSDEARF